MSYGSCIGARFARVILCQGHPLPGSSSARVILCHNPAKRSDALSDDVSGTVGPPSFFRTSAGAGKTFLRKERFPSCDVTSD